MKRITKIGIIAVAALAYASASVIKQGLAGARSNEVLA
jgi:hypothetical protein